MVLTTYRESEKELNLGEKLQLATIIQKKIDEIIKQFQILRVKLKIDTYEDFVSINYTLNDVLKLFEESSKKTKWKDKYCVKCLPYYKKKCRAYQTNSFLDCPKRGTIKKLADWKNHKLFK